MPNNKDFLSQDEIDALLQQSAMDSSDDESTEESSDESSDESSMEEYLSPLEKDALGEIGNITFGSAATALSTLLGQKVDITTPVVSVVLQDEISREFPDPHVIVHVKYVQGFNGTNVLVIHTKDARIIADLMMGGEGNVDDQELNEFHVSAVQEAMNQMMGSSATSMSTIFNRFVNISPPGIDVIDLTNPNEADTSIPNDDVLIQVSFRLKIGNLIDSSIMQLLPVDFAKEMVSSLMGGGETAEEPASPQEQPDAEEVLQQTVNDLASERKEQQHNQQQQPAAQNPPASEPVNPPPMQGQPAARMNNTADAMSGQVQQRNINVQPAQFSSFENEPSVHADDSNLNLLMDIPLKVTVELGRTQKPIREIIDLTQGSIIELDKLAGEPVDILVNNKLIAKGEVVVIDENFGVRVIDIVNPGERIRKIQ